MNTSATASPVSALSRREEEVLALMAEGRTNAGIAHELVLSCGAIEKHVANIFAKLGLPASPFDHRRVLAVLTYVRAHGAAEAVRPSLGDRYAQIGADPLRRPVGERATQRRDPQYAAVPMRPVFHEARVVGADPLRHAAGHRVPS